MHARGSNVGSVQPDALPPPVVSPTPPGWYPDPWRVAHYRWWDGRTWAANIANGRGEVPVPGAQAGRRPRLRASLSAPVVIAGLLLLPLIGFVAVQDPVVLALALIPLLLIIPVLIWIDRLEPEPWASRVHSLLWGATISVLVAGTVNGIVLINVSETAAAVVSAPLVEETMKGLGILWAVRRREVDGPVDGLVYAGWVGAGFAMVENLEYFLLASEDGVLAETFIARGLITPFAHPLFTAWIGLAIGIAVARKQRLPWAALWGLAIAVALHAGWNGSLVLAGETGEDWILVVAALGFLVIFGLTVAMVILLRGAERRRYLAAMPHLAQRYQIPVHEIGVFSTWSEVLAHRRRLPRSQRRRFDEVHAALSRLAALYAQPGTPDLSAEYRLAMQVRDARAALAASSK
jgi:RsiW-degrading membrane proteinase PrsW (M82 family)